MKFWKRLVFAFLAMVISSVIAGWLWRRGFDAQIPAYFSGVIGGLAALGAWELSRRK